MSDDEKPLYFKRLIGKEAKEIAELLKELQKRHLKGKKVGKDGIFVIHLKEQKPKDKPN